MPIGAIEGAPAPSGTPQPVQATTGAAGNGLSTTATASSDDKDMFLQLLVAQMKYQDPMNPTDSADFLSQSAQFTSLEKMQLVAEQTAMLLGAQMAFGASSLVGRSVSYTLEDGTEGTGTVHGVSFGDEGPVLDVDGVEVPIANVLAVTDPQAAATAS
ncbi:flagellar hook capping FlgD N-terminal domain-containing protein [Nocardioides sp.]|uniref:flagellar hook assembly protein FlgD n=1 Tax=Nocardioides sp. TaxID=35761 RepID=UPI0025DCEAD9|nr:flagellar hook capping FlgD N-terminal domain-containing protein [Nocardioides sp.]